MRIITRVNLEFQDLTVGEDHGREAEPEYHAYLMPKGTPEIFVDSVLKNPYKKPHENERAKARQPKLPRQRLQKRPCIFALIVLDRYDHRNTGLCIRQGEVDVLRPVCYNSYVSNRHIEVLSIFNQSETKRPIHRNCQLSCGRT